MNINFQSKNLLLSTSFQEMFIFVYTSYR